MNEYNYQVVVNIYGGEIIKRTDADGKESWIPVEPANSDYQTYLKSLEETA